jgi:hypothetical protein
MGNQDLLNETVKKAVNYWVKYLKPAEEDDGFEQNPEPTILEIQLQINYPTAKELDNFAKKLAVYIILKLEENESFIIETKEFPIGEFETLVSDSGIDKKLFRQSTKMEVSLGQIKVTNFIGQEEIIKIS